MFNESLALIPGETPRVELKSYNVTIPMASLSIGVDNIHHDVFLSPKFVQAARDFLFDLIRQQTKATYFPGIELRTTRGPEKHRDGFAVPADTPEVSYRGNREPVFQPDLGRERMDPAARRTF
jgi:hypothetical protein